MVDDIQVEKREKLIETKDKLLEEKLSALDPHEANVLRSQLETKRVATSFFRLFRFCTPLDVFLEILALFFAAVHGAALPMFTLVVGAIFNTFRDFTSYDLKGNEFQHKVNHLSLYFVYIGIGMLGSAFLESFLLVDRGEVLAGRYRKHYLSAVIRQNIAFYDKLGGGEVSTRIINDTNSIQEAISDKLGNVVQGIASFIAATVISFASQWKLACILLSAVGFMVITMGTGATFMAKYQLRSDAIYSQSGATVAEEALSAVRTTVAFGAQPHLAVKYEKVLDRVVKESKRSSYSLGVMLACIWASTFWVYALALWQGSREIVSGSADVGKIIVVITAMLLGSFQLGNIAPNVRFLVKGLTAASILNEAIDRVPVIDGQSIDKGIVPQTKAVGRIELKNVKFRYPSRPDVLVLSDFSLEVPAGSTVALVGASGSGKSTIVGILERFYLPLEGSVTLDGQEISDLNTRWLRQQIGYVQQEPVLFSESIYENISYGLIGTDIEFADEHVKEAKIIQACKDANAWDFIQTLSEGIQTNVGDRGFLLSGGQKQRIAIARAIVSDPKILLLDEATSALDTKSEGIVQDALDKAAEGRTTIVVAHRLSTIKDANKIVVMSKGNVIEQGTHNELIQREGPYKALVDAQRVTKAKSTNVEVLDIEALDISPLDSLNEKFNPKDVSTLSVHSAGTQTTQPPEYQENDIPGVRNPPHSTLMTNTKLVWGLNRKEWGYILIGSLASIILGYCYPAMAIITGQTTGSMVLPPSEYGKMRHVVNIMGWWYFFVGCISFMTAFITIAALSLASDKLVKNIRLALFRQLMRMDIAFFDHKNNTPGALTSILAKEAKMIEGLSGATLGQIQQSLVTLIGGIVTGIPFNWRIGLVATSVVPVMLVCGFVRVWVLTQLSDRAREVYERSGSMASEYTSAVRTVQSLTRELDVVVKYTKTVDSQIFSSRIAIARSALYYALSEGMTPWVVALVFWWGSTVMRRGEASVAGYMTVFMAIITGSQAAGQIFSYAPNMNSAKDAARNIYRILTATPSIDVWSEEGYVAPEESVRGDIEFRHVNFRYPTRPQVPVLQDLNLTVKKGQYIALVGASGCGKSTTIGLVERFYDPLAGQVLFDGKDLREYNLNALRSHIALVQQEPMLYSGTLRENILMGWSGPESEVTQEMIEDAARKANIHEFIMSLPDGYETLSGSRGSLLSGGQKQRIAIARALIRNPKVLLLDEATSALDSESEKVVQAALDAAAKGRTTIAVAHRLSTIQKADVIYVFSGGRIVEQGDHQSLLELNGWYAELVNLQGLGEI
uniref:Sophorolipid transporter n=1 Tax=Starmerella bombicola TaxID=75736 RepID=MDR_STABO|nr:RecName: Full=Sophorolipid transporter [Starmerella bombicola]AET14838.1 multidrug resistance protein [Starmerella bombicola]